MCQDKLENSSLMSTMRFWFLMLALNLVPNFGLNNLRLLRWCPFFACTLFFHW